jgi:hypothetical protein
MNTPRRGSTDHDGIPANRPSADHVWELHPEIEPVAVDPGREELREFFGMIGGLGARARRRYEALIPARVRSRTGLIAMALVASFVALAIRSWLRRRPSELPIELQGAWSTNFKDYADRGFWIGRQAVAFQVGPNREDVNVFPVTHLAVERSRGDTTWYTITYAVDGGSNNWSIRHVSLPHPAIVFTHQPQMTWTVMPAVNSPAR